MVVGARFELAKLQLLDTKMVLTSPALYPQYPQGLGLPLKIQPSALLHGNFYFIIEVSMSIILSILIVLIFMFLLWLLQNIQHEALHALMAAIFGAIDIKLYPLPTWEEGKIFPKYWAHMLYNSNGAFKDWQYGILSCAPQLANTLIMLIIFIVLMTVNMPHLLSLFLLALFLTNFIDGAANLGSLIYREKSNGNDAWSAIFWLNIKLQTARVIVICWYVIFAILWFILAFL